MYFVRICVYALYGRDTVATLWIRDIMPVVLLFAPENQSAERGVIPETAPQ